MAWAILVDFQKILKQNNMYRVTLHLNNVKKVDRVITDQNGKPLKDKNGKVKTKPVLYNTKSFYGMRDMKMVRAAIRDLSEMYNVKKIDVSFVS